MGKKKTEFSAEDFNFEQLKHTIQSVNSIPDGIENTSNAIDEDENNGQEENIKVDLLNDVKKGNSNDFIDSKSITNNRNNDTFATANSIALNELLSKELAKDEFTTIMIRKGQLKKLHALSSLAPKKIATRDALALCLDYVLTQYDEEIKTALKKILRMELKRAKDNLENILD